jgi:hypothetical protein
VLGLYRDEIPHADRDDGGLAELSVLKKAQLLEVVGPPQTCQPNSR